MNLRLFASATICSFGLFPVQAALVSYFPLDGTAGTFANTITATYDDATHGVAATGTTNVNNVATWVNDVSRGSVLNSTGTQRFLVGTQDIDMTEGFTWSFWAKSGADVSGVVMGTRSGTWHKLQFGEVDGPGLADFRFSSTGANDNNGASTFTFGDGSWHHVAYVGSGSSVGIYIDGVYRGGDTSVTAGTNANMEFGGSTQFSEFVDVQLDDIGIWNERLTLQQITDLANGTITPADFLPGANPIPEPSSALLGAMGALMLLYRRK